MNISQQTNGAHVAATNMTTLLQKNCIKTLSVNNGVVVMGTAPQHGNASMINANVVPITTNVTATNLQTHTMIANASHIQPIQAFGYQQLQTVTQAQPQYIIYNPSDGSMFRPVVTSGTPVNAIVTNSSLYQPQQQTFVAQNQRLGAIKATTIGAQQKVLNIVAPQQKQTTTTTIQNTNRVQHIKANNVSHHIIHNGTNITTTDNIIQTTPVVSQIISNTNQQQIPAIRTEAIKSEVLVSSSFKAATTNTNVQKTITATTPLNNTIISTGHIAPVLPNRVDQKPAQIHRVQHINTQLQQQQRLQQQQQQLQQQQEQQRQRQQQQQLQQQQLQQQQLELQRQQQEQLEKQRQQEEQQRLQAEQQRLKEEQQRLQEEQQRLQQEQQQKLELEQQQQRQQQQQQQQQVQQETNEEENEPEPEIDIVINNVVCSFSVRCHLNLREIALNGKNVEFRRENGMVTMKLRRPYTTASIWSSGRITCTGATSEDQAKIGARRYARCLQGLGFPVRFNNFRVVNVLGTCSMPWAIKIVNFSEKYKKDASYEPELHPGVTYKLRFPKATLKIFSTGSITVTAGSVADVQTAIEHIFPLVYEFRKKRNVEPVVAPTEVYDPDNDDELNEIMGKFDGQRANGGGGTGDNKSSKKKAIKRKYPFGMSENDPKVDNMIVSDDEINELDDDDDLDDL